AARRAGAAVGVVRVVGAWLAPAGGVLRTGLALLPVPLLAVPLLARPLLPVPLLPRVGRLAVALLVVARLTVGSAKPRAACPHRPLHGLLVAAAADQPQDQADDGDDPERQQGQHREAGHAGADEEPGAERPAEARLAALAGEGVLTGRRRHVPADHV